MTSELTTANAAGAGATTDAVGVPAPRRTSATTARTLVRNRVLVVAGSSGQHTYPELITAHVDSLATTGLVVCGTDATTTVRRLRAAYPNLFLMIDPVESERFSASADDPYPQAGGEDAGLIPPATLAERVDAQIRAGASVALTPTGYIRAGDHQALRAVITEANKLVREDVVVLLPLANQWLIGPALKTISAAVSRCVHPVAITLCDSNSDPMRRVGVLAGAQSLASMQGGPMFHRTDLAGLHLMAHGALAASVGVIASKRRGAVPRKGGTAYRTKRGANVLVADLLRYRRSLDMQDQWYASRAAPVCDCGVCGGQALDRFSSDEYDCLVAAQHNALGILDYVNNAASVGGFPRAWSDQVRDAITAHEALSQYVGTVIDPPVELVAWSKNLL
jgi:hypothetical protein